MKGDASATMSNALIVFPVSLTFMAVANQCGAYLQKRWNPKYLIGLGHGTMIVSLLIATFSTSWWAFVFFYSVCFPTGIGFVYQIPLMCGWEWFPDRKGLVSGLVIGGFGLAAFTFGFITTAIANPEDFPPTLDFGYGPEMPNNKDTLFPAIVAERVPKMFLTCIGVWTVFGLTALACITRNPVYVKAEGARLDAQKKAKEDMEKDGKSEEEDPSKHVNFIEFRDALKTLRFWQLCAMLFSGMFYGIYMASVYKTTAQDTLPDKVLTYAGMIGSICNGGGRVFWGTLMDKGGFKRMYFVLIIIQIILGFTIWHVRSQSFLYPLWVGVSFLGEGGHLSMFPAVTCKVFGIQYGGQIFTIMFYQVAFASLCGFFIKNFGKNISYAAMFNIASVFSIVSFVLLLLLDDTEMKSAKTKALLAK